MGSGQAVSQAGRRAGAEEGEREWITIRNGSALFGLEGWTAPGQHLGMG